MRALRAAAVAALSLVLFGAGCAPAAAPGSPAPDDVYAERALPPRVRVTNNHWSNMTVYAVRGTSRFRLGMVTSMSTAVFRLPPAVIGGTGGVQLLADPIGGSQGFLTPAVYVHGGEEVKFEIQNHLPISSVSVFSQW